MRGNKLVCGGRWISFVSRAASRDFTLSRAVSLRRIARYVTEISNESALINFPAIIPVNPLSRGFFVLSADDARRARDDKTGLSDRKRRYLFVDENATLSSTRFLRPSLLSSTYTKCLKYFPRFFTARCRHDKTLQRRVMKRRKLEFEFSALWHTVYVWYTPFLRANIMFRTFVISILPVHAEIAPNYHRCKNENANALYKMTLLSRYQRIHSVSRLRRIWRWFLRNVREGLNEILTLNILTIVKK